MKKLVLVSSVVVATLLAGCGNMDLVDTVFTYDEAIIQLADGTVVRGRVDSWRDYDDGDQIQVTMVDGATYLVHSDNVTLICN